MTATEWKKIERMAKGIAYRNGKKLAKDQRKPTDNKSEMESEKARKRGCCTGFYPCATAPLRR